MQGSVQSSGSTAAARGAVTIILLNIGNVLMVALIFLNQMVDIDNRKVNIYFDFIIKLCMPFLLSSINPLVIVLRGTSIRHSIAASVQQVRTINPTATRNSTTDVYSNAAGRQSSMI